MAEFDSRTLTPTEDLVMEVLAARARLGESLWTFDNRHRKALFSLDEKGLINWMSGTVENTMRASLTQKGRDAYLDADYQSPVEKARREGQKATAMAWSAFLELFINDELEDGTKLADIVLGRNPELRKRLGAALTTK